ncbi:MAG: hypothetical protein R3185_00130 [Candidatus Thermoplasmatota archaeon]|nr:hypothetical protein [Candidatus Thermoplasmatota archaeon]
MDQANEEEGFDVPAGTGRIVATLDWTNAANDLDMVLYDPFGEDATGTQAQTGAKPEQASVAAPQGGTWTAEIRPWSSGPDTYTLTVEAFNGPSLPTLRMPGPKTFGTEDTQRLFAAADGGTGPFTFSWDTDLDGVFEHTGASIEADLPVGDHEVALHAQDANGFEARTVKDIQVVDAPAVVPLRCAQQENFPYHSMEWSVSGETCWFHHGHHTYRLDAPARLLGGEGVVVSVEQQFTPPTEYEDPPFKTPIRIETSLDLETWEEIGVAEYRLLEDPREGSLGLAIRQSLQVTFEASEEPFQYVRVYNPRSSAQGLSGFLDASRLDLFTEPASEAPAASEAARVEVTLSCEEGDHLEAFFEAHPCWFGGINRYDAPSFLHTYPVSDVPMLVGEVSGEATVLPWRSDDWFEPVPLSNRTSAYTGWNARVNHTNVSVQASVDGMVWRTLERFRVDWGQATTFDVILEDPVPARFLRLVPDPHERFDQWRSLAPNHHPEGFLVHSGVSALSALPSP